MKGEVKVTLMDNMGIQIPKEKVLDYIKAFWRNDSFYLDISYSNDPKTESIDIITPRIIEDYMKEIDNGKLLNECKGKLEMDVKSRQKIVQYAVDFMISTFGVEVSMFRRTMTANALISLFPFIGSQDGQNIGIVCSN